MKIDLFNHFFPKRFFKEFIESGFAGKDIGKRVRNVPTIADLDARFRVMRPHMDHAFSRGRRRLQASAGRGEVCAGAAGVLQRLP